MDHLPNVIILTGTCSTSISTAKTRNTGQAYQGSLGAGSERRVARILYAVLALGKAIERLAKDNRTEAKCFRGNMLGREGKEERQLHQSKWLNWNYIGLSPSLHNTVQVIFNPTLMVQESHLVLFDVVMNTIEG